MKDIELLEREALKNKIFEYEAILEPRTMHIILDLINRADTLTVQSSIIEQSLVSGQQIGALIHINKSDLLDFYARQLLNECCHVKTGSEIFVEKILVE